jgi:imidazole glycerol-phosphate synthase subunit HisH
MSSLVVLDYGMGNLRSVAKAFEHVGPKVSVKISGQLSDLQSADRLVLPGQGALPDCMKYLNASGLREGLLDFVRSGRPLFGVCVGEQMLFEWGEEGRREHADQGTTCLGLFPGKVRRFSPAAMAATAQRGPLKVPHMGWNRVRQSAHPIWSGIPDESYFYFVHSYFAEPLRGADAIGHCEYGERFTCAVANANIVATQFHPEKSAALGLKLYENFLSWCP